MDRSFGRAGIAAPDIGLSYGWGWFLPPSPFGALQLGKVVIAWNQDAPSGLGGLTSEVALQRFTAR
jgi:hypothetical protein